MENNYFQNYEEMEVFEILAELLKIEINEILTANKAKCLNENLNQSNHKRKYGLWFLMKMKEENELGQIENMIDFEAIDEKYYEAITTVCLIISKLVVKTIDTAEKCVEHLKKIKLKPPVVNEYLNENSAARSQNSNLKSCPYCSFKHLSKIIIRKHILDNHKNELNKNELFGCSLCLFKSRTSSSVESHMKKCHLPSIYAKVIKLNKKIKRRRHFQNIKDESKETVIDISKEEDDVDDDLIEIRDDTIVNLLNENSQDNEATSASKVNKNAEKSQNKLPGKKNVCEKQTQLLNLNPQTQTSSEINEVDLTQQIELPPSQLTNTAFDILNELNSPIVTTTTNTTVLDINPANSSNTSSRNYAQSQQKQLRNFIKSSTYFSRRLKSSITTTSVRINPLILKKHGIVEHHLPITHIGQPTHSNPNFISNISTRSSTNRRNNINST